MQEYADALPSCFDGSLGGLSQQRFELGEDLLDWIEIWTVGRQEEELGAGGTDGAANGFCFMAAKIVDDDDVARLERWDENLFDVSQEAFAIDWPVDDARSLNPIAAQSRQEGQGPPMTLRYLGDEFVPTRGPATQACHVGFGPGLIDEDQTRRIKPALTCLPTPASTRDVGTILLGGEQSFF